jgi:hypothetical protein
MNVCMKRQLSEYLASPHRPQSANGRINNLEGEILIAELLNDQRLKEMLANVETRLQEAESDNI